MFVILVYDFGEKRTSKALKICRKYLNWVQNSVFEGDITPGNLKKLKSELKSKMDTEYDSIIIYILNSTKYTDREVIGAEKNAISDFL